MSETSPPADDLRRHFVDGGDAAGPCPSAEDWWIGWRSELSQGEVDALVDHAAICPQCSFVSRVAREMVRHLEPGRYRGDAVRPYRWFARSAFAAAAAIVLAVVGLTIAPWRDDTRNADMRGGADAALRSLVDEKTALARGACLLRWAAGPEGTVYNVEVTDEAMRPLATGRALRSPEFLVPEQALADLPRGDRIVWQVTAVEPDGRRVASHTFFSVVD
jgi:hypothetical protein